MVLSSLVLLELVIITSAPCSRAASATQKPIPEEPPRIRIRWLESLVVYFRVLDMVAWLTGAE